jgi:hypothetical protein
MVRSPFTPIDSFLAQPRFLLSPSLVNLPVDYSLYFSSPHVASSHEIRFNLSLLVDSFSYRSSCFATQIDDVLALESGEWPMCLPFALLSVSCPLSAHPHEQHVHRVHFGSLISLLLPLLPSPPSPRLVSSLAHLDRKTWD